MGQVPFTGSAHCGLVMATLESTLQQSCPPVQQKVPQQVVPALHVPPPGCMHAGMGPQLPLLQNGVDPEQMVPHAPQLRGSL